MWADVDSLLLAEIATAVTNLRWMEAIARIGDEEELPQGWELRAYGPADSGGDIDAETGNEQSKLDLARAAAAELLA
ncbi:hypothetical protein Y710_18180 [Gordonia sp. QH-12]|uniref:Uncharacterized protein n=1 Tax=Gordonia sihwensis NBRC 108236 TaxID=1223544 RepID=L7LHR4_9ACTN|nr:hypothetical protein CXX93_09365 [Gordonia sp. YC-JH1]KXT55645.1 hypothetical protein Y710_18180 [Gordonia sp. QH-12]GAC60655.1 hypothetical protein GSI01S_10_02510 [Gordonia sihwensis NBRC 108236]